MKFGCYTKKTTQVDKTRWNTSAVRSAECLRIGSYILLCYMHRYLYNNISLQQTSEEKDT